MATLKEQTLSKHTEAENLPFIKSIFNNSVDKDDYIDYLYQLAHVYHVLEEVLGKRFDLFTSMQDIKRAQAIMEDFNELSDKNKPYMVRQPTLEYMTYLMKLDDSQKAMAHVYVRHMGDLFGGQQLAKLVPGSAKMYQFENIKSLVQEIRSKINDDMGPEAIIAFDFNIKMIKEYS